MVANVCRVSVGLTHATFFGSHSAHCRIPARYAPFSAEMRYRAMYAAA